MDAIIGIDPGLDGGIAIIADGKISVHVMPFITATKGKRKKRVIAVRELSWMLSPYTAGEVIVFIEKVGAMKGQGVTSMFNFGMGYGILQGLCGGLGIPYQLVHPMTWKKVVLEGLSWKGNKEASVQYVTAKYPMIDLRATERCKNAHLGKADALCIAEYGRLREREG